MFKRAKSSTQLLKNGTWQHLWNVVLLFVLIKVVSKTKWMMVKRQQKKVCKKNMPPRSGHIPVKLFVKRVVVCQDWSNLSFHVT